VKALLLVVVAVLATACGSHAEEQRSAATLLEPTFLDKGLNELNRKNYDAAIAFFEQGFNDPDPANSRVAYFNAGVATMNKGDLANAETLYQRSVEIDPTYDNAWLNLGVTQRQLGKSAAAVDSFTQVLDASGDLRRRALLNLAELSEAQGSTQQAAEYRAQAELTPTGS
jgi:Tfp pilus assembly protein PilF